MFLFYFDNNVVIVQAKLLDHFYFVIQNNMSRTLWFAILNMIMSFKDVSSGWNISFSYVSWCSKKYFNVKWLPIICSNVYVETML